MAAPYACRRRSATVVPALLLALVGLGGCALRPEPVPPEGVSVVIEQARIDIVRGLMSIQVVNDGDQTVTVVGAEYDDGRLAAAGEWSGERDIPAGRSRDLRIPIPDASCDHDPPSAPRAELRFLTPDGEVTARYDVTDPFDFVATTTAAQCFQATVATVATVALTAVELTGSGTEEVAHAVVDVHATGDVGLTLVSIARTGLLQPLSDAAAWEIDRQVTAGQSITVDVPMIPARCDLHAIAEDKVGTRFPLTTTIDGPDGGTGVLVLPADGGQRGTLYAYVQRWCASTG